MKDQKTRNGKENITYKIPQESLENKTTQNLEQNFIILLSMHFYHDGSVYMNGTCYSKCLNKKYITLPPTRIL